MPVASCNFTLSVCRPGVRLVRVHHQLISDPLTIQKSFWVPSTEIQNLFWLPLVPDTRIVTRMLPPETVWS